MGVTWAVKMRPGRKANTEVDPDTWGGFRVDGTITRRVTKLFPPDDSMWGYGESEAWNVGQGDEEIDIESLADVQGGRVESFPVIGRTTAKLLEGLAKGDLSWLDEEDGEDRGGPYDRR